ncbi:Scr1 family TA system antitoxin-like transcriptional regulator [Nocardia implantans]|uniref:Helix-turn-helix transcriptional regulator n=1 Tax=Nocardia implantans TaxID=3108168 RepID=A0ABU6AM97_9NOCA|nr:MULTISPECIES: Scr1 family TA system antitoxin-like transcriptional regulator [unclassified Nocardia]MBF6193495.1 helix-turn-helix domain-containing protein [Nocardia beijingensis]MEA3532104.1 helix-turn-helix transcriptional regulator [Nocardia sp. CDC192]MEB3508595.1 helix-turn-helix transcriptional regulator [Nocardia sp. CDC186]
MSVTGSTLARRALGRELRRLRIAKRISQAEAARLAETSPQSIGRIEEGQSTRVTSFQVNALCDAYGASDTERRILLGLVSEVRAARERGGGYWRAYADAELPTGFDHYLALEEAAHRLTAWKVTIIPGLLQTAEYRRALAWSEIPELSPEAIEGRIELAARRQTRLADPEFTVDVLLSEAAVRDQVGGPGVMTDQLLHLSAASELPNVSVRVVPFTAPKHLGSLVGSFILLEFPELPQTKLTEPPIVYVEEYAGDLYLEREAEVARYRSALREIDRVALDHDKSKDLILAVAKEYGA